MLQLRCVCLVNRRVHLSGGCYSALELASPFLWCISVGGGSWDFHIVLLSSIQKSCTSVRNSLVMRTGLLLTSGLPKVHRGCCPWPLLGRGLWQWFSKLLTLVSLGTKSQQESELYLSVQESFWKMCYKMRKKWNNFKGKWIIGAMAARCWQARENWGAAWQILLSHSSVNEKSPWSWKVAYLPIGVAHLKITPSFTNQKWALGSQERFWSDNIVFNKVGVMDSFLSCGFSFHDSNETVF